MPRRQKMFTAGLLIGIAGTLLIQILHQKNADNTAAMPATERAFVQTINTARTEWNSTNNNLAKAAMPASRATAICQSLANLTITDWTGTITTIDPDNFPDYHGKTTAHIIINLTTHIHLETPAAPLLNNPDNMIEAGTPLYATAANLPSNSPITFSGTLFPNQTSCITEDSLTTTTTMTNPTFKLHLTGLTERGSRKAGVLGF